MRKPKLTRSRRQFHLIVWSILTGCIVIGAPIFLYWIYQPADSVFDPYGEKIDGITNVHLQESDNTAPEIQFDEVAEKSGIVFHHFPFERNSYIVEDMGAGLAWGDYDGDGDEDLFLVNFSAPFNGQQSEPSSGATHALYQNQGDGTFVDVSKEYGVDLSSYGMGAAWGDFDNDGDLDLYVTNIGSNLLFQNNGNGGFTEIAKNVGLDDDRFGAGCMWGDYNRDGWIDLYVCNYVDFVFREGDVKRKSKFNRLEYPHTLNPSSYASQPNRLYRNNGDGTFTDVAESVGVDNPEGRSLAVSWTDFDLDGYVDLYIANDVSSNAMYRNMGNGTFEDVSSRSLTADYRGAMGIAVGDYDRDADLDLFITHWLAQENALYQNMMFFMGMKQDADQALFFTDVADEFGLGQISLDMVGWSTSFIDFDNDGWLDLWISNGNTLEQLDEVKRLKPQAILLFHQQPEKGFYEIGAKACDALSIPTVTRGGAFADYNADGRIDFALQQHGESPLLFLNTTQNTHNWIQIELKQNKYNTQALGARVILKTNDGLQLQQVGSQASYLSQNQNILHFGLGENDAINEIQIFWPDGREEIIREVDGINQKLTIIHEPEY
ncbi:MAG: CRTAC1 family protein [Candidatus Hinthialibacter antarcticus]|nr:CRTAC1 family protein [Candidatus Hinthialibacter antarcticus]